MDLTSLAVGFTAGALPMAALWRRAVRELRRRPIVVERPRPVTHVHVVHPPYDWARDPASVAS